jgi:hypothetical protein
VQGALAKAAQGIPMRLRDSSRAQEIRVNPPPRGGDRILVEYPPELQGALAKAAHGISMRLRDSSRAQEIRVNPSPRARDRILVEYPPELQGALAKAVQGGAPPNAGEGSNPSSSSWGKYTRTLVTQVIEGGYESEGGSG